MSRKNVHDILTRIEKKSQTAVNVITYDQILDRIEGYVLDFVDSDNAAIQEYVLKAKLEGWLGSKIKKCPRGLLGYLRTGFGLQIKILEKLPISLPIGQSEFVQFFRSDWFRDTTLQNGCVRPIYKKEHIELLKKYPNYL